MSIAHPAPGDAVPTASGSAGAAALDVGHFRVSHTTFQPCVIPWHHHERACLTVMLNGTFTEAFAGRSVDCGNVGVLAKPAGERHRDVMHGSQQLIVEPDEQADDSWPELRRVFDGISYVRSPVACAIASRITGELRATDAFTSLAVEGLTLELFVAVSRSAGARALRSKPVWLDRIRERLHDDTRVPVLAELAALAQVHPAYMARLFRQHFSLSIGRYARKVRLEWAARELTTTDAPVSAIALRAGFADQSHFTRAFRAQFGLTPHRYRLATVDASRHR